MPKFTRNTMAMNMDCLGMPANDWTCIGMLGIASCLQKLSKLSDYSIGKPGGSLVSLSWLHCDADLTIRPLIGLVLQCYLCQKIRGCMECLLSQLNASIVLYVVWMYLIYLKVDQEYTYHYHILVRATHPGPVDRTGSVVCWLGALT